MARPVVAFLGPEGSYTHQATLSRFPAESHDLAPQRTISDIFTAVSTRAARLGVVPFENSTNGSVVTTLDLLASTSNRDHVRVSGEVYLPVSHALCVAPRTESVHGVTRIYSHPQAWGQCTRFLAAQPWKGLEKQDVSSTSRGAELVATEGESSTSAAISSVVAAERLGLKVWEAGIEDVKGNATRFLVLEPAGEGEGYPTDGVDEEAYKTLVLFIVSHSEPGALADSLAVFKRFGLNLTSINTRPSGHVSWNYVFFVELIGRKSKGDAGGKVNEALRELDKVAKEWRWMGSWENQLISGR